MTKYKDKWCQEAYNKGFNEGRDFEKGQLTKAKDILREIIDTPVFNQIGGELYENEGYVELVEEAERFLREVGK